LGGPSANLGQTIKGGEPATTAALKRLFRARQNPYFWAPDGRRTGDFRLTSLLLF